MNRRIKCSFAPTLLPEPANDDNIQSICAKAVHASIDKIERFLDDLRADLGQPRKAQD